MKEKAKLAVLTDSNTSFEVREYPVTEPGPGMARMKLLASGICGTDIHIYKGKIAVGLPSAIGHEFVGQVEAISPADSQKYGITPGDNVIVNIACPCGHCSLCETGDQANCVHMGVTNGENPDREPHFYGGYGEYNFSPAANLIKLPAELNPETACVFACAGPTTLHAVKLAERSGCRLDKMSVAVVQGLGPVGMFALLYLSRLGIRNVIAVTGRNVPERAEIAKAFGAAEVMSLSEDGLEKIADKVNSLSGGLGADLVFEASGNPEAVSQGLTLLRNRGVYLVPGQYSNSGPVPIRPELITFHALHIIGSSQYDTEDVQRYIGFLREQPQYWEKIGSLAARYSVSDINKAFADAMAGKNIKTMLTGE